MLHGREKRIKQDQTRIVRVEGKGRKDTLSTALQGTIVFVTNENQ